MSNIIIKYDDLDITETVEKIDISMPFSVTPMKVPKAHGAKISEVPTIDPKRISIKGTIDEQDATTLRTTLDNYEKVFARYNKKFRIWDDRHINTYSLSFNYSFIEGTVLRSAAYTIDLFGADPFWYSDTSGSDTRSLTSADTAVDITNGKYKEAFTLNNAGSAYTYPKFTITAVNQLTQVIIRNLTTGRTITYTGTVAIGKQLVIDCANFLVTNDGAEDLTNFNGSFLWLQPGNNSMEFEGSVEATYLTEWNIRYY